MKNIINLFIKTIIIYLLFYIADFLFSIYNHSYISMTFKHFNIKLFILIIGILLIKNFWVKVSILGFLLFLMFIQYCYYQYFGTFIQPIAFWQILFNINETFTVFSDEILKMIIPFFIFFGILLVIIIILKFLKNSKIENNIIGGGIILVLFTTTLYNTCNLMHFKSGKLCQRQAIKLYPQPKEHSLENFMRSLNYFLVGIVPKKIFSKDIKKFTPLSPPKSKKSLEDNNIVLVIGESLRAKELSILGYKYKTTPKLEKINNLIAKTIYSAGTMTKVSVSALLNRIKYPGVTEQIMNQDNNLFKLAKEHNYTTYFYSWQSNAHLKILQTLIGKKYIDNYASKEIIKKILKTKDKYDINLIKMVKKINLNKGKHFIVLQQRGSHAPYKKQYPKKFKKFKKSYDNTVLYTDYVLSKLIKYLKENSHKPTYFIFTSDHGELLHEHGRNGHGWFFPEVYKVPFIAYAINANYDRMMMKNIQSHFDVSNLVISLLGYDISIEKEKEIYVNGSDVDALAGYLYIKVDENNDEIEKKLIR